ncbi:hypothetical protein SUGI_0443490 [Cryptomeria japonica]|uniref:uncharacterized protein LOC131027442 n=1 Tax=Cryptomeria japonica TaxID=3369 RepID=UPI002408EC02|nr:uncharacterized protein LOC131027442 [Cryptomeria japonica]XP_057813491.1 uncharacterized protein LOC131027442 [Cryptomeria japonica]XP_057813492.1 uncharacterized protein LOC131027442 [Cryptomeria japonica]XP_057813493.1 uncharacterized protein LOC131027442 [Cryptomeria japonica]XP_057813494.1 uncharacterized protein LOC131027442 [Cryptomeria japonica]GLJ23431.1 hypothetical protein SUGI_0443490 [Cryptomeria japonica]
MGDPFSVQISAGLVQRLVGEEDRRLRRKTKPKVPRSDPKKNDSPLVEAKHPKETDIPQVEAKASRETEGWQPILPLLPGAVFPPLDTELNPIRKVLHESERVMEKLQKEEARMAEEVKRKAKELHEKEYRMPEQKSVPCSVLKDECVQCYKSHPGDPLQCAEAVKAFAECARQVHLRFAASG